MHMPNIDTVRSWQGATLVDRDGDKVGTIEAIYVDDQTGEPEWTLVNTGLFGTKASFVPLAQASGSGDQVQVPYEKQLVKDAPRVDTNQHLSEAEEQQLWTHYGLEYGTGGVASATVVKTALTGAALAATAWSRALGATLDQAGQVPVEGGTESAATTPEDVAKAKRQLKVLQWVSPALTGAVVIFNARMGEQQRPTQVSGGLLGRFRPGRAT
jgi:PRC-barrel domain